MRQRALVGPFLSCLAAILLTTAMAVALALATAGCKPPVEPLKLDGNMLTVANQSTRDWTGVEIWLNRNHRVTVASIPAGSRMQVPLDAFVAGFGQRFNFRRTQITDVRLTAKLPDGNAVEVRKQFTAGGLAGVFGGKH